MIIFDRLHLIIHGIHALFTMQTYNVMVMYNIPMYETKQSRASVKNFSIILSKFLFASSVIMTSYYIIIIIIMVLYLFIVRYGTSLHDKLYM